MGLHFPKITKIQSGLGRKPREEGPGSAPSGGSAAQKKSELAPKDINTHNIIKNLHKYPVPFSANVANPLAKS